MADGVLHIGVDGRELAGKPTGVGRYVRGVLGVWSRDPTFPHRVSVFLHAPPSGDLVEALGPRVGWVIVPSATGGTRWEQRALPRALARAGIDVLFAGAYTAPLRSPCPFVLVIHDVSYFAHPEWFRWREGLRRRVVTRAAARRAAAVVTVSRFSADEIARWVGIARSSILLAPQGAPPVLHTALPPRPPVVLYAGSLFNRRLIPELIAGFALAARDVPGARLVLAGDNRTMPAIDPLAVAAASGVADAVEWRRYVSDTELAQLYASARAFVFLSTYEGFGMTPMEAIAAGAPAVLLDTPVGRDIYGDGARFVTAAPASIAAALVPLLTDDRACADLLAAGRARLAQYSWTATAATIRTALEDAARRR